MKSTREVIEDLRNASRSKRLSESEISETTAAYLSDIADRLEDYVYGTQIRRSKFIDAMVEVCREHRVSMAVVDSSERGEVILFEHEDEGDEPSFKVDAAELARIVGRRLYEDFIR